MDKLWAPWRSKYIYLRKNKKCIFCGNGSGSSMGRHVVCRSRHSFAMLNLYPYNNGHIMVAPYRHVKGFELLSESETIDIFRLMKKIKKVLDRKLKPHGYNIGMNLGKIGGAGFTGHMHIHIVPRWIGDTNFMPITAGTKIVSESLDEMKKLFSHADA